MKSPVQFSSSSANPSLRGVIDVDPSELAKFVTQDLCEMLLIDVRTPEEYTGELGHIAGTQLIVLDTIPECLDELPKDETIVFVCKSGGRSAQAAAFAAAHGYEHVFNMKGGMLRWNQLGLPTVKTQP